MDCGRLTQVLWKHLGFCTTVRQCLSCPPSLSGVLSFLVLKEPDESHTGLWTWSRMSDTVLWLLPFDTWWWGWWWVHAAPGHGSISAAPPFSSFTLLQRYIGRRDHSSSPSPPTPNLSYNQNTSNPYSHNQCALTNPYYSFQCSSFSRCTLCSWAFVELRIDAMDFPEKPTKFFIYFFFFSSLQRLALLMKQKLPPPSSKILHHSCVFQVLFGW